MNIRLGAFATRALPFVATAAFVAAATAIVGAPGPATAANHVMEIQEIFPGTPANPDAQYVELKMAANGQNLVSGTKIFVRDATGLVETQQVFATFTSNVPIGQNGRRVLACTAEAQSLFNITCDAVAAGRLYTDSGWVKFGPSSHIMSYGDYVGPATTSPRPAQYTHPGRSLDRESRHTHDDYIDYLYRTPTPEANSGIIGLLPPGDYDSDSVQDATDNCPNTPNGDQADTDADGLGDPCDRGPDHQLPETTTTVAPSTTTTTCLVTVPRIQPVRPNPTCVKAP